MDPSLSNSMMMDPLNVTDSSPCTRRLSSLACLTLVRCNRLPSCSLWFRKENIGLQQLTYHRHGEVFLYDSLFTGSLTPSTEEQLVRLYRPAVRNNCLMVTAVSVQEQEVDCCLFSIAAAYLSAWVMTSVGLHSARMSVFILLV